MPYTTLPALAAHLGRALTADQAAYATAILIPAAQHEIDRLAGRSWEVAPITGERHLLYGQYLTLRTVPVTSVDAVSVRYGTVGDELTELVTDEGYEVLSLASGLLRVAGYDGWEAVVDYTPATPVPEAIQLAANLYVAEQLATSTNGASGIVDGVKRYSVAGEETVEFFGPSEGAGSNGSVPRKRWQDIARGYRVRIFA